MRPYIYYLGDSLTIRIFIKLFQAVNRSKWLTLTINKSNSYLVDFSYDKT